MMGTIKERGALFFRYLRDLAKTRYDAPYELSLNSPSVVFSRLRTQSDMCGLDLVPTVDERLIRCRARE